MSSKSDYCKLHGLIINSFCTEEKIAICEECIREHSKHANEIFNFPEFIVQKYKSFEFAGQGSFGIVFKTRNIFTDSWKAIKFIRVSKKGTASSMNDVKNEARLLEKIKHKNVMSCNEVFSEERTKDILVIIIMEFCQTNLKSYLFKKQQQLKPLTKYSFIYQIASGVRHLHQERVMHRDLKPENIFMKEDGKEKGKYHLKIGDFGISILLREGTISLKQREYAGTRSYMSPEVLNKGLYNKKTDVWACGVIFYQILFNLHPYQKEKEDFNGNLIAERIKMSKKPYFIEKLEECPYKTLISKCLEVDINKRYTAMEMLAEIKRIKPEEIAFEKESDGDDDELDYEEEEKTQVHQISLEQQKKNFNSEKNKDYKNTKSQRKNDDLAEPLLSDNMKNSNKGIKTTESTASETVRIDSKGLLPSLTTSKKFVITQTDFDDPNSPRPQLNLEASENFKSKIRTIRDSNSWRFMRILELKIDQTTYDKEFIGEVCAGIQMLENLRILDLTMNNKIVFIETKPCDCLGFYALVVLTCCIVLINGRSSPCSFSSFYCPFNESIGYRHQADALIDDVSLRDICKAIGGLQYLNKIDLDLSYNKISSFGLLNNVKFLNENKKDIEIKLIFKHQLGVMNSSEIEDLKNVHLKKMGATIQLE